MANVFFDNPPILQGDERTRLEQLNGYLNTLSSKLNEALTALDAQEITLAAAEMARTQIAKTEDKQDADAYNTLRSMIIKTATVVRHEMDEITAQLKDEFFAKSEIGELERRLEAEFEVTAEGVMQQYSYDEQMTVLEKIAALDSGDQNAQTYIRQTQSYIYSGLLDDSGDKPIYGIAIGENVTNPDGSLNPYNRWATFTSTEISFYAGGSKLGYYAGDVFHIQKGEVLDSLKIGNFAWKRMADKGLALILDTQ